MFDKLTRRPIFVFQEDKEGSGGGQSADGDHADASDKGGDEQKKLDKQFAERAKRAAEAERKKLFESIGVKDEKEFEAYLTAKKDAEDKQKTEVQRLADEAKEAKSKLERLQSEQTGKLEAMQKRIMDTEIKVAASVEVKDKDGKTTRAAFRTEALSDILLLVDRSKIEEKDGEIVGIEKALADLAKAKPYLLIDPKAQSTSKGTPRDDKSKSGNRSNENERERIFTSL